MENPDNTNTEPKTTEEVNVNEENKVEEIKQSEEPLQSDQNIPNNLNDLLIQKEEELPEENITKPKETTAPKRDIELKLKIPSKEKEESEKKEEVKESNEENPIKEDIFEIQNNLNTEEENPNKEDNFDLPNLLLENKEETKEEKKIDILDFNDAPIRRREEENEGQNLNEDNPNNNIDFNNLKSPEEMLEEFKKKIKHSNTKENNDFNFTFKKSKLQQDSKIKHINGTETVGKNDTFDAQFNALRNKILERRTKSPSINERGRGTLIKNEPSYSGNQGQNSSVRPKSPICSNSRYIELSNLLNVNEKPNNIPNFSNTNTKKELLFSSTFKSKNPKAFNAQKLFPIEGFNTLKTEENKENTLLRTLKRNMKSPTKTDSSYEQFVKRFAKNNLNITSGKNEKKSPFINLSPSKGKSDFPLYSKKTESSFNRNYYNSELTGFKEKLFGKISTQEVKKRLVGKIFANNKKMLPERILKRKDIQLDDKTSYLGKMTYTEGNLRSTKPKFQDLFSK
ncbi:MAG: hypothetical protein MJ252_25640 [archaeon]|nr:hypothetical protein [archaeon]